MTHVRKTLTAGLLAATAIALVACGSSSSGSGEITGLISLDVSDGPISDANKVCIAFNEIEFKSGDNSFIEALADNVNLLEFQGNNSWPLLTNLELPAGDYQWMRLGVSANLGDNGGADDMDLAGSECDGDKSYLVMNSGSSLHNLYIPSGAMTGLKLVGGFTIPVNGSADFTAEFDLMKSVTAPGGLAPDVILRPTIRLVNNVEVGTLTGEVAGDLATAIDPATELSCEPSVYVFDDGVVPNAIEDGVDDELDPVATAMVNEQTDIEGQVSYHYTVGYLLPGNYEVAFTCDGTTFEPVDGKPAEIFVQEVTEVNFP
jgi:hypothetical protein